MVPRRPPFWKFDTVDPTSPWFPRSCMKTHEWTFAKVGATMKFWSRDHYPICIHGSRSRCFTCIAEQATSEVVDMFSRGGRDCHFANTSVEMAKFFRAAVQLLRQCIINPWIQTASFLIIAIAATSGAVSWQFAGWISLIPPRLYSIAVNKGCLQCGQMFLQE